MIESETPSPISFPRIFGGCEPETGPSVTARPVSVDFAKSFEIATGWKLDYVESGLNHSTESSPRLLNSAPLGTLTISDMSELVEPGQRTCHRAKCDRFVQDLDQLVKELRVTQRQLSEARAELATNIPVVIRPDDSKRVAELLKGLLRSACDVSGAVRAGLYLLDDATEYLRLHASVGLDRGQQSDDIRLLADSVADIEALAGHVIAISDSFEAKIWAAPIDCGSAVCVPVSSASTLLGTLWVFGDCARDFPESVTSMLEIVAGRIAAELEREAIARQVTGLRSGNLNVPDAAIACKNIDIPFQGWSCAAQVDKGPACGPAQIADWTVTDDETVCLVCGTLGAEPPEIASAAVAATMAALDAAANDPATRCTAERVVAAIRRSRVRYSEHLNSTQLICAVVDPFTGLLHWHADGDQIGLYLFDCQAGKPRTPVPTCGQPVLLSYDQAIVFADKNIELSSLNVDTSRATSAQQLIGKIESSGQATTLGLDTPLMVLHRT